MDRRFFIGSSSGRGGCLRLLAWPWVLWLAGWAGSAQAFVVPGMSEIMQTQLTDPWPPAISVQRGSVSLQEAQSIAMQRFPGRVVRAETVSRGGRVEHHVRILAADGRVRTVRIDAQTGQFL